LREERLAGGGEIGTQRGGQIAGRVQREVAQDGAHEQQRQLDNVSVDSRDEAVVCRFVPG
jgi:hypothetical protein